MIILDDPRNQFHSSITAAARQEDKSLDMREFRDKGEDYELRAESSRERRAAKRRNADTGRIQRPLQCPPVPTDLLCSERRFADRGFVLELLLSFRQNPTASSPRRQASPSGRGHCRFPLPSLSGTGPQVCPVSFAMALERKQEYLKRRN